MSILGQKRDSGAGTLTSTSDRSSGIKSTSTPSTPQAESGNFHAESRLSHSLLTESSPSADLLSEAREDREVGQENFLEQETPLVCGSFEPVCEISNLVNLQAKKLCEGYSKYGPNRIYFSIL